MNRLIVLSSPLPPHQATKMTMNFNTRLRKAMNKENPPPGSTPRFSLIRPLESYMSEDSSARSHRRLACWQAPACLRFHSPFVLFCLAEHERVMGAKRIACSKPSGSPANRLR